MRNSIVIMGLVVVVAVIMSSCVTMFAETKVQDNLNLDKIPPVVMDGLKAKFPRAEIRKWSKEKEGGIVIYDIEFEQWGRNFEADIKEDGSIHNWERAISYKELPQMIKDAVYMEYPDAVIIETMRVNEVKSGKDILEGYEITLKTADRKEIEIMVVPDGPVGKIIE